MTVMITVEDLKQYLRIDGDEEDELLEAFIGTATAYLTGAVEDYFTLYAVYPEFAAKADLLTAIFAAEYYQNRNNEVHDMSFASRALMAQLQNFPIDPDGNATFAMFDGKGNLFDSNIKMASDEEVDQFLDDIGLTVEGGLDDTTSTTDGEIDDTTSTAEGGN